MEYLQIDFSGGKHDKRKEKYQILVDYDKYDSEVHISKHQENNVRSSKQINRIVKLCNVATLLRNGQGGLKC